MAKAISGRLFEKKVSRTAVGLKAFKRRPLTDPTAGFEFRENEVSDRFSPFRDKIFGIMRFFEAIQGFAPWRTYGRYPGQRGGRFSGKSIKRYRYGFIDKKISNCYVNRKFVLRSADLRTLSSKCTKKCTPLYRGAFLFIGQSHTHGGFLPKLF